MLLRHALPLVLLLAAPVAAAQANLSSIFINEILPDPTVTGEPGFDTDGDGTAEDSDEFIELFNASGEAVDLSGWRLYDASTTPLRHTFEAGTVIPPQGFVVVVGGWDPGTPPPGFFVANGDGGGSPGLGINNGGDELFLYDPDADAYIGAYFNNGQGTFGGPGSATNEGEDDFGSDEDGLSLERRPAGTPIVVVVEPSPGTGLLGLTAEEGPEAAGFALSAPRPNPTAADAALTLTVARTQVVEVAVYDVTGRRLAVLLDRTMGAGETASLALNPTEVGLPPGVYLVRARGEGLMLAHRLTVVR